jgi:hypothetical protein
MPQCPVCREPDGQFIRAAINKVSTDKYHQIDTYHCTHCEFEWQAERQPREPYHRLSLCKFDSPDFELTAADVG